MKKIIWLLLLSLIFSTNLFAQKALPTGADPGQTQKWLQKNLVKEVRSIRRVKFEGCRMVVQESLSRISASQGLGGFVGGGFPNDEASRSLSAGAGSVRWSNILKRQISFDLVDFDVESIKTRQTWQKDKSLVILKISDEKNLVTVIDNKKTLKRPTFEFVVKTKSAGKFADAFRQAIGQCQ